jgi:ankyrin repeat protein
MSIPPLEQKTFNRTDASSSSTQSPLSQQTLGSIKTIAEKSIPKPSFDPPDWTYRDENGNSILHLAAATGTYKQVSAMLRNRQFVPLNKFGQNPCWFATQREYRLRCKWVTAQVPSNASPDYYAKKICNAGKHIQNIEKDLKEAQDILDLFPVYRQTP